MINEESLRAVGASALNGRFLRPIYDTYGFARVPDTTTALLAAKSPGRPLPAAALGGEIRQFDKVVVILLDAFGWAFMDRALGSGKYPLLERIANRGVISKLSTQFPSTTTAHITTLKFGTPVGQHGLYEWNLYEPAVGEIIIPFMFAQAGGASDSLRPSGVEPSLLYPPGPTYFQQLAALGVSSYLFETRQIAKSTYNSLANLGATSQPYKTLPEGLVNMGEVISRASGPAYFYLYYDGIDAVCHTHGPHSAQVAAEIDTTLTTLERILLPALETQRNVALILTADHGHSAVDPQRTVYLNQALPPMADWLKRDRHGKPLKLAGSPRDVFLHLKPECVAEAEERLKRLLSGKAEVYRTADLMEGGWFGPLVSERLRARMADLLVLSYENESAWWYEKDVSEVRNRGSHGGLERNEAETFFGFLPFDSTG